MLQEKNGEVCINQREDENIINKLYNYQNVEL